LRDRQEDLEFKGTWVTKQEPTSKNQQAEDITKNHKGQVIHENRWITVVKHTGLPSPLPCPFPLNTHQKKRKRRIICVGDDFKSIWKCESMEQTQRLLSMYS
jgi:hypothetical protein